MNKIVLLLAGIMTALVVLGKTGSETMAILAGSFVVILFRRTI